jgi:hypothetical protein
MTCSGRLCTLSHQSRRRGGSNTVDTIDEIDIFFVYMPCRPRLFCALPLTKTNFFYFTSGICDVCDVTLVCDVTTKQSQLLRG